MGPSSKEKGNEDIPDKEMGGKHKSVIMFGELQMVRAKAYGKRRAWGGRDKMGSGNWRPEA